MSADQPLWLRTDIRKLKSNEDKTFSVAPRKTSYAPSEWCRPIRIQYVSVPTMYSFTSSMRENAPVLQSSAPLCSNQFVEYVQTISPACPPLQKRKHASTQNENLHMIFPDKEPPWEKEDPRCETRIAQNYGMNFYNIPTVGRVTVVQRTTETERFG